jgi:hypothetical protein
MANNYHWEIETMDVIPNSNGLTYVVDRIGWKYHGTDPESNNTAHVGWSIKLNEVDGGGFIEYSSLTLSIVEGWLESILNVNDLKSMVDAKVELLNNPSTIQPPFPWIGI